MNIQLEDKSRISTTYTKKICWLLLMLSLSINMLSIDIYLPAMPSMSFELYTTPFILKLIFIINFIEFSLSPLIFGAFSDIKGRKQALFICLTLAAAGQILSAVSLNAYSLMAARFIQYLGAGALSSIILTLICDNFRGYKRAKAIATFEIALPICVALGPLLGASLLTNYGWKGSFLLFSVIQVLCLLGVCYTLFETLPSSKKINYKDTFKGMLDVLKDPISARIILILGLTEGGWMIFTISSAFIYIQHFKLVYISYAYFQTMPVLFFFLGMGAYRFLIGKLESLKLFKIGISGYVFIGMNILLFSFNFIEFTPINLCLVITGMNFFCGFISPNGNAIVLNQANENLIGTSSATFTAVINFIVGVAMLWGSYIINAEIAQSVFVCLLFVVVFTGFLGLALHKAKPKNDSIYVKT